MSHRHPSPRRSLGLRGCAPLLAALFATLPPTTVVAAPQSPFVAAGIGVWTAVGDPVVEESFVSDPSGPLLLQVEDGARASGKARASFGSLGFQAQTVGGVDREVDGGTLWSDGFTVSGGSGEGTLTLGAHIGGTISGRGEIFYGLFVSSTPFDMATILAATRAADGFWQVSLPNATRVFYTGIANGCGQPHPMGDCGHVPFENFQGNFEQTLSADVRFQFGQPLYVLVGFGGGMGVEGGSEDFYGSANFTIDAPQGAQLSSLSGTVYATAVPEPASLGLLLAGLCLVGAAARRQGA